MNSLEASTAGELTREAVDRLEGRVVLEFGTTWCNHCQALAPHLAQLLQERPALRHIRVEDGRGKPLGRSFRVKLWPTLILLRDGRILEELVRPTPDEAREALDRLAA